MEVALPVKFLWPIQLFRVRLIRHVDFRLKSQGLLPLATTLDWQKCQFLMNDALATQYTGCECLTGPQSRKVETL